MLLSGNFPRVFPKWKLPKSALAIALGKAGQSSGTEFLIITLLDNKN